MCQKIKHFKLEMKTKLILIHPHIRLIVEYIILESLIIKTKNVIKIIYR